VVVVSRERFMALRAGDGEIISIITKPDDKIFVARSDALDPVDATYYGYP
jgi:hypothetical protein